MKYNINIENLKRMYNHILLEVDDMSFFMGSFSNSEKIPIKETDIIDEDYSDMFECDSVGCIIGHCAFLDYKNIMENFSEKIKISDSSDFIKIDFYCWSLKFLNIKQDDLFIWDFLFSSDWCIYEKSNTRIQALARIKMIIEKGVEYCFNTWNPSFSINYYGFRIVSKDSYSFEVTDEEFLTLIPYNHASTNELKENL